MTITDETRATIVAALEGDSNDAEHDALVSVAQELGLDWTSYEDRRVDLCGAVGDESDGEVCHLPAGHGGLHSDGDARWQ